MGKFIEENSRIHRCPINRVAHVRIDSYLVFILIFLSLSVLRIGCVGRTSGLGDDRLTQILYRPTFPLHPTHSNEGDPDMFIRLSRGITPHSKAPASLVLSSSMHSSISRIIR